MFETILLSTTAFIGTNIDDLFINMFFFSEADTAAEIRSVVLGKYLGIGLLTAVSLLGARGLQFLPLAWLSLLGFVPIALGVREVIRSLRRQDDADAPASASKTLWLSTMLVTIANGADNIGVYIPLFSSFAPWQMAAAVCVFLAMNGLWCLLARRMIALPVLKKLLERYKPFIVPVVYISLGLYILC